MMNIAPAARSLEEFQLRLLHIHFYAHSLSAQVIMLQDSNLNRAGEPRTSECNYIALQSSLHCTVMKICAQYSRYA